MQMVFHSRVAANGGTSEWKLRGESEAGMQLNIAGDAQIGHVGDTIDTGGGDHVARDKVIHQYIESKTIISIQSLTELELVPAIDGVPPYKGLAYFTEADKDIYFGREKLSDALTDRLQVSPFLAVIGASGSGKSSLLRAGVIPRLREGNHLIHVIKPGARPLMALAATLSQEAKGPADVKSMQNALRTDSATLSFSSGRLVSQAHAEGLLLVVDQFEELFTQGRDSANLLSAEKLAFVTNLIHAARAQVTTTLLLGMRADFYDRLSEYPELAALVSQQQVYINPMTQEDLVRVIAEPAQRCGWKFVQGLVEQIVEDVGREPGRLPLLSHALRETWERRRGNVMTLEGYRNVGGVEGAIAHTAQDTLNRLVEQNDVARAEQVGLRCWKVCWVLVAVSSLSCSACFTKTRSMKSANRLRALSKSMSLSSATCARSTRSMRLSNSNS